MPIRHPLKDLPLESFMYSEHRTAMKRPLSPSATLLSPSKRRILSAEGLYSLEKRRNSAPSRQLFSNFLDSPPSPARKLDFAALSHPSPRKADARPAPDASFRPQTPSQRAHDAPRLAPSPEISSSSALGTSTSINRNSSPISNPPPPLLIPRDMPTFSDRQSVHWPGFDVHADTYIAIPTSETIAHGSNVPDTFDGDDGKENVKPRKRAGKGSAQNEGRAGKNISLGQTEHLTLESGHAKAMLTLIPPLENKTLGSIAKEQERKQNRLIMVRELDHELNEEGDVDQQL